MASNTQRAYTSIPLASSWKYDVFLSFRGKETRNNFTGHLYKALKGKRIRVFKDDRELETGSAISEELWTAIEESKFAIIVFSQDYASSEWCLDELVKIFKCMGERETIIPIFYNVDTSDVKHQTGTFEEAFNKHENDGIHDTVKVQGWKTTLTTVCGRAGHVLEAYQSETEFIEKVVDKLYNKLVCAGCNGRVGDGLNCLGAVWHRACLLTLLCKGCNHPFTDLEIRECGDQQPYHERCYELEYLVCNVCKKSIQDGQVEYKEYPFWRRRYCSSHVNDGTPRCCSCERLKPRGTTYYKLDDGRKLCQECKESIINTDHGHRSICLELQKFYKKLNVKVEKIPVRLVRRQVIIDAMKEGNDDSDRQLPVIRAVCLFEKSLTSAIMGRPSQLCCEVKEILIWYGLPRILTGSLLAQLMMRAWLRLDCCANMSPDVEKGICRYFAHRWLDYSSSYSSKKLSEFEEKLCRKRKTELDCEALLTAKKAVCKHGLGMTLETIRKTGKFPL